MKNHAHKPPMAVIMVKSQNVPFGLRPPAETSSSMEGTARELPYWLTKWKHITIELEMARMRRG
jgi:hypothetical protein